ncbi:MAG: hypothetical protein IJJ32_03645 [Eggerthellaceae bacterium]|nr:hypothetical protein [Eggerthellaceae bacterium]
MSTNNHKSLGRIDHVDEDADAISGLNADSENPFDEHCPDGQFLAENLSFGITLGKADGRTVFQFNEDRFRHTAIIGRTGSGKSNHIMQMEREDIRNGAGVAIIAAHEEDALYPLMCVPKERIDDVIILDPTNARVLPCLNPLDVEPTDKAAASKAVSDCIQLLKSQCYHEWAGPRFDQMARLALETMLDPGFLEAVCVEHTKVAAIPCVPASREQLGNHPHIGLIERMYTDPDYVRLFLPKLTSKHLYDQWKLEASSRRSIDADDKVQWFLSKLDPFFCDRVLKNIFGPGKKTIDIKQIVDEGKILVAIIPEHRIGHDAAALLRTWLLMQLKDAILARGALDDSGYFGICSASKRKTQDLDPFFVYVDEFGEQASLEFASFLAESRKYHVGFTLAFQNLAQMSTFDTHAGRESSKLLDAILGNVGTVITYPIGSSDTTLMARQLNVDEREVANIRRYHPLARVLLDNEQRLLTLDVDCKPKPDDPDMPETLADNQIIHNVWLPVRRN